MRATVLGGFAAPTSTGAGCSGYLIRDGGTAVVADLGAGTLVELRRHVDVRRLDAVVISHGHLDHVLDLGALHHLLRYSPTPLPRKTPLYVPPGATAQFGVWERALHGAGDGDMLADTFEVAEYDPDTGVSVGHLTVRFAPTVHPLRAWAMRFSVPGGGSIGYTADTGPSAHLDGLLEGVDLLISEATLLEPDGPFETRGHLTAAEAGALAARVRCSTLILTHRWEETDGATLTDEAARTFPGTIELSGPGLTVDAVPSHV